MKISDYFGIRKSQAELDFVDVDSSLDTPLFVDPYAISRRGDPTSLEATEALVSFFQAVVDAIRGGDDDRALALLSRLNEPRDTFLGLSRGRPQGRGIHTLQAAELHERLRSSKAVETGFLSELAECEIVIPGIGFDKISDISTNIVRAALIRYTQRQCNLEGIPLIGTVNSGPLWDAEAGEWTQELVALPVMNHQRVLFVPRFVARRDMSLDHNEYYQKHVLNFLQLEESLAGASLARVLRKGRPHPTKKELKGKYPLSKEFLFAFSQKHPEVLDRYKKIKTATAVKPETHSADLDPQALAQSLKETLGAIPTGNANAARFQHLVTGIAEFLFYPDLIDPRKEHEIDERRKRIDIVFVNDATQGFFGRRRTSPQTRATHPPFECKNYSEDPTNPEFDQLSGRFSNSRGWFGFLVARKFEAPDTAIKRCQDAAKAGRGFMVPLGDQDWTAMLDMAARGDHRGIEGYLENLYLRVAS